MGNSLAEGRVVGLEICPIGRALGFLSFFARSIGETCSRVEKGYSSEAMPFPTERSLALTKHPRWYSPPFRCLAIVKQPVYERCISITDVAHLSQIPTNSSKSASDNSSANRL